MFILMKTDYFQLWLLDKSNKNIGIVRSNTHLHLENDNIFSIDQIMVTRAGMLVVRRALPSLHGGSLEITQETL